ncbi:MAG: hypothetical protein WDW36_005915 [Sanguina aurantia]
MLVACAKVRAQHQLAAVPRPSGVSVTLPIPAFLQGLNEEQRHAVICPAPAVRITAGPGSGKTRVVASRVAWLLDSGVPAWNILLITFTNKAAEELKTRIAAAVGPEVSSKVMTGTFHSVCARILRRPDMAEAVGRTSDFTIQDNNDSLSTMQAAIKAVRLKSGHTGEPDSRELKAFGDALQAGKAMRAVASRVKAAQPGHERTWADPKSLGRWLKPGGSYVARSPPTSEGKVASQLLRDLWDQNMLTRVLWTYSKKMQQANAVDFEDLLSLVVSAWVEHPHLLERHRKLWRHCLVDEFQDTNLPQYEIVKMLAGNEQATAFVVGDPDQAIYSWRGADAKHMDTRMEGDFPGLHTCHLRCNYRSGKQILAAAELVMSYKGTPELHEEGLVMRKDIKGEVLLLPVAQDEVREAQAVALELLRQKRAGVKWSECAVLYRTNLQSRVFQDQFSRKGIPFTVVGDIAFWAAKEVRDVMAYLRLASQPLTDVTALERIINVPKRAIGAEHHARLVAYAASGGLTLPQLLFGDLDMQVTSARVQKLKAVAVHQVQQEAGIQDWASVMPEVQIRGPLAALTLSKAVSRGLTQLRGLVLLTRLVAQREGVHVAMKLLELLSGYRDSLDKDDTRNSDGELLSKIRCQRLDVLANIAANPSTWITPAGLFDLQQQEDASDRSSGEDVPSLSSAISSSSSSSSRSSGSPKSSSSRRSFGPVKIANFSFADGDGALDADSSTPNGLGTMGMDDTADTDITSSSSGSGGGGQPEATAALGGDGGGGEEGERPLLARFLEHASLVGDTIFETQAVEAVQLMTLHSAKGLEFEVVAIAGFEEGLLPMDPRADTTDVKAQQEEEKRLAYVGITRAKALLILSYATLRRKFGGRSERCHPSPFLEQIISRSR